jgi:phage tail sheath protein FI
MVQVSYPGVYIREVSSGVRTITGVATSIAAIVGMARRGPVGEPRRVLGFLDYERLYSSDTSLGEMTDQVRQFFQNGGQQAFIVRVAQGAAASTRTLVNAGGTNVLTLTAASPGTDGAQLRVVVDYNTAAPERTFNLRLYRELLDASGNPTIQEDETHKDLSMNPADGRYFVTVLEQSSALATGALHASAPGAAPGYSIGAALSADPLAAVNAAIAAVGTTGSFRVRVGTRPMVTVSSGTIAAVTDLDARIKDAYGLAGGDPALTLTSVIGTAPLQALKLTALGNEDVVIEAAPTGDIARRLGLGIGQGGVEVGAHAARRPRPSGYVSILGTSSIPNLLAFADIDRAALTNLELQGGPDGFTVTKPQIVFSAPAGDLGLGTAATGTSLANVRENLLAIAGGINNVQTKWRAEVHGHRLAILPRFGNATSGTGYNLNGTPAAWDLDAGGQIFDSAAGAVAQRAAEALVGGSDGSPPQLGEYTAAFDALRKIDLFNIMLLPRTHADPERRAEIWGPASTFCLERRAFLLVDASLNAGDPDAVLGELAALRIGLVKDHAGLYWPRLTIAAGAGLTRDIDPSGSIAGLMSRIDSSRGVWKAPAGLEADIRGIRGVAVPMSDPENGLLNPQAVNAIRLFPNGVVSWGARTMDGFDNSGNDDYKYVPVRRFALFIEESLFRGLKFAVFEPNDEPLWAQIRLAAGAFMNNLFRQGAFAGKTKDDAYFVKVDRETTTQNDINLGIVNVVVGFAPLKPAEFVVVTIQQKAGQVQV